jgi:hypothetical protein
MADYNLAVGSWATGVIVSETDQDTYHIDLSQGATYDFYAANIPVDTVINLFDPLGNLVATDDDNGWGFDSFINDFVAPSSGSYSLTVDGFGAGTGGYAVGVHDDFQSVNAFA